MEIQEIAPALQIEGLQPEAAVREMALYVEAQVARMQREIFSLRQFLEPAIKNNDSSPDQEFSPLT